MWGGLGKDAARAVPTQSETEAPRPSPALWMSRSVWVLLGQPPGGDPGQDSAQPTDSSHTDVICAARAVNKHSHAGRLELLPTEVRGLGSSQAVNQEDEEEMEPGHERQAVHL